MGLLSKWTTRPLRRAIRARRLKQTVRQADRLRVIIGAGGTSMSGWIATDEHQVNLLEPSTWHRFFADESLEALFAEHVWEHLTAEQGRVAARTCYQFLQPGGYLRVAVPDGNHPSPAYIDRVRPGGTGAGADDHKVLYTCESFSKTFEQAGFEVQLREYFDAEGEFHTSDWDASKGVVQRTLRFDKRNEQEPLGYTSLFLDAVKPAGVGTAKAA